MVRGGSSPLGRTGEASKYGAGRRAKPDRRDRSSLVDGLTHDQGVAEPGMGREELFAGWRLFFERLAEQDPGVARPWRARRARWSAEAGRRAARARCPTELGILACGAVGCARADEATFRKGDVGLRRGVSPLDCH